jgi:hypothetical protein
VPSGDFLAVSVTSRGDWLPETVWPGAVATGPFVNADLEAAAARATAAYGYTRVLGAGYGSVTVFFNRASRRAP